MVDRLGVLRDAMDRDLRENVLPFWAREAVDRERGGFHGYVSDEGVVDPLAPKGGVLCARILWTFSAVLRRTGNEAHRQVADRAFAYLRDRFSDPEHGGTYWMLDHAGRPVSDRKQTYALAFSLYALAEYHRATGSGDALERAVSLYRSIERHAADPRDGGYWEARARDWSPLEDVRLSDKDLNAPKSMNTHLHVMEAYANLLQAWEDASLRERLRDVVALHLDRIVDPATGHLRLFFDERWAPVSRMVSYGHDIEASWLLVEAAEAAGDRALLERAKATAVRLARVTLAEGVDAEHGGVFAERHEDERLDDEKH
jgi:mannobiose 2-epimerase